MGNDHPLRRERNRERELEKMEYFMRRHGKRETEKPPPVPVFDAPWRKIDWCGKDKLLDEVKAFQPQDVSCKHLRILLHGPVGSGKSSFINSISSVFRGRMVHNAKVDNAGGGDSFTVKTQTHKIEKEKRRTYHPFVFRDLMGLEANHGIHEDDIKLTMKGHVKDDYTFNEKHPIQEGNLYYNAQPTPDDKAHVLVCVIPAVSVSFMDQAVIDKIRNIRLLARDLDIAQICVITKIDEAHPMMAEDIKNVYRMKIVKEKMEEFSTKSGIPMTDIFPVKNYHEETELDDDIDVLLLTALKHMVHLGEDFIYQHYYIEDSDEVKRSVLV